MLETGEEALKKITEQVEVYFQDYADGMVSLALICSSSDMKGVLGFMKGVLGLGEEDVSDDTLKAVGQAFRTKSTTLKVSEDGMKVQRTTVFVAFKLVLRGSSDRTQPAEDTIDLTHDEHSSAQITQESVESEPKHTAEEKALRRELHLLFRRFGEVKFVDLEMKGKSGYVRFAYPEGPQEAHKSAVEAGSLNLKDHVAILDPVAAIKLELKLGADHKYQEFMTFEGQFACNALDHYQVTKRTMRQRLKNYKLDWRTFFLEVPSNMKIEVTEEALKGFNVYDAVGYFRVSESHIRKKANELKVTLNSRDTAALVVEGTQKRKTRAPKAVRFKIEESPEGKTEIFIPETELTFENLQKLVSNVCSLEGMFSMFYKDIEGDWCILMKETHMEACLASFKSMEYESVRLKVTYK